jgi:2-polyprenyl-3-methyl-5-hydroxy-6-metoxy-1,4-benzoquinol methylase
LHAITIDKSSIFNVRRGIPVTVNELFSLFQKYDTNYKEVIRNPERYGGNWDFFCDISRALVTRWKWKVDLAEGDTGHQKVGWGSAESQRKRFKVLSAVGGLGGCSMLDVGCGIGGLYEYLSGIYTELSCTGVDINQSMLKMAASRNSGLSFYLC